MECVSYDMASWVTLIGVCAGVLLGYCMGCTTELDDGEDK
jgi:hypothetical protein